MIRSRHEKEINRRKKEPTWTHYVSIGNTPLFHKFSIPLGIFVYCVVGQEEELITA
jgi:hypothetical protein